MFIFPKDECLRAEWIRTLPNQDMKVIKSSCICIQHFHADDVITE